MRRIHFAVTGKHPLLYVTRDYLIQQGYVLVPLSELPEASSFVLAGYQDAEFSTVAPVLLLSSSSVYGDRDTRLVLREPTPMDEAHAHVITSPLDPSAGRVLAALLAEWTFLNRPKGKTIIVRPFNVFGPGVESGVVHNFVQALRRGEALPVHTPGRQSRTFLYIEDFLEAIGLLTARLVRGSRGIYNIGSTESVEILSLAKSVGHAFGVEADISLVETCERHQWWKLPAVDRIRVDARWKPRYSLRSALFHIAGTHGRLEN